MRRSKSGPWFKEFSVGLGYSRTFIGGTTYKVDESGNVSIVPLAGYNYFIFSTGIGMGYNFQPTRNLPLSIYSRLSMLLMFPYNSTIYPRPTLEIGIIYVPARFLEGKVHVSNKLKKPV